MSHKDHPVLYGAAATLLAAFLLWLFGKLASVLSWIWRELGVVIGAVWRFLAKGQSLTLPGWVWTLASVVFLVGLAFVVGVPAFLLFDRDPRLTPPQPPELNDLQTKIVRALAREGPWAVRVGEIETETNEAPLRVDQALDQLVSLGLISKTQHAMYRTVVTLTNRGRDFAIEQKMV